jgi:hypothetical protein
MPENKTMFFTSLSAYLPIPPVLNHAPKQVKSHNKNHALSSNVMYLV